MIVNKNGNNFNEIIWGNESRIVSSESNVCLFYLVNFSDFYLNI